MSASMACASSMAGDAAAARKSEREIPRRRLGRTGVEVSMIGLGGYHVGIQDSIEESVRIIRSAIDRGISFLDNCWDYNEGQSEERMGRALEEGYRGRVFLMTKIDGRTKDAAAEQIDQSLRRLRTEMIDLIQVHEVIRMEDPDRIFGEDGAIRALIEARRAGKVRFIGFTGHKDPSIHLAMLRMAEAHGFTFDAVQMPLNVMDAHYRSFEHEVLPVLTRKDIGVLGMKPMGAGAILRTRLVTAPECLRYALSLPTSAVITGCDSMRVLDQAIEVATSFEPLSDADRAALLARTKQAAAYGEHERFKTTHDFDGTVHHPGWLETAEL
jgi:aryl-alcohol dehydrogenase-like predicted oxidoreductase